jgi:hypothetical protein
VAGLGAYGYGSYYRYTSPAYSSYYAPSAYYAPNSYYAPYSYSAPYSYYRRPYFGFY